MIWVSWFLLLSDYCTLGEYAFPPPLISCGSDQNQNYEYVVEAMFRQNESENTTENETQEPEAQQPASEPEQSAEPEAPQPTSEPEQNNNDSFEICSQQTEGTRTGDCAQNFSLKDQNLQTVSLHDFYGDGIWFDGLHLRCLS